MKKKKICFFNRSSIHYRKNIWMLMDQELPCDFYFGDNRPGNIASLDNSLLKNFKGLFHNITFGPLYWQKGAMNLLRSGYTDIITSTDPYCISSWILMWRAKRKGVNVYLWGHGAYGNETGLKRWLRIRCNKLAKGVFLYGNYAKNILKNWGFDDSKLHVIYNSLDYDQQFELRKDLTPCDFYQKHFGNDNPNIVFIGRLTKIKKLDQILSAVKILKDHGKEYNISFVGDGVQKDKLMSLAERLGLAKQVWFYGACYDEKQISNFIYNADMCVSPGNVGLTAMHAMTFGLPVITHDNFCNQMPEYEAIDEGETGAFFKENDVDSLAKSIQRWFENHSDREKVRQACYKVIDEKYNPHVQVKIFKDVIYNEE